MVDLGVIKRNPEMPLSDEGLAGQQLIQQSQSKVFLSILLLGLLLSILNPPSLDLKSMTTPIRRSSSNLQL
jgi:hypothetical protein